MADGTQGRGNTIAEKIAQFRAVGITGSPQRSTRDDAFWWQRPSPSRHDTAMPRLAVPSQPPLSSTVAHIPGASPGYKSRSQQPESDARYRGIDQNHCSAAPPSRPSSSTVSPVAVPPPAAASSVTVAALQRLAQEHPTLYHAVMTLERGADGRLTETALQLVNQALARSTAAVHGSIPASLTAPQGGGTVTNSVAHVGHTTTTIVPELSQQPPTSGQQWHHVREEVRARAQAALAAAAAATTVTAEAAAAGAYGSEGSAPCAEESMDKLLARYRSGGGKFVNAGANTATATALGRRSGHPARPSPRDSAQRSIQMQLSDATKATAPVPVSESAHVDPFAADRGSSSGASQTGKRLSVGQGAAEQGLQQAQHGTTPKEDGVGVAATPADAAGPATASRRPSAEKLQKILKLANMASRMSGPDPDGLRSVSAPGAPQGAAQVDTSLSAVTAPGHTFDGGVGAGGSRPSQAPQPKARTQPDELVPRRSKHAGASSSAMDLAGEPSLSALPPQTNPNDQRRPIAPEIRLSVEPCGNPSGGALQREATAEPEVAAAEQQQQQQPSTAPGPVVEPPERAANPLHERATAPAGVDVPATAAAAAAGKAAAGDAPAEASLARSFAFPVTTDTAAGSTGSISHAVPESSVVAASTSVSAAAVAAARRVQFSPNEPQVRLYSEGTTAAATTLVQQTAGVPHLPGPQAMPGSTPGAMQPVFLLPSPTPPDDPNAPRPTHIFVPANPSLPPALVSVPGFEPLAPGSVKSPQRQKSQGDGSVSRPRRGQRSKSSSPSPAPRGSESAAERPRTAGDKAGPGSGGGAATSSSGKQRSDVDRVLDSDSDTDSEGGRIPANMAVEMRAAEQAAAQVEREVSVHMPNRLTRLLDQVATFKRTEGERLLREGERLKMVEELKAMNIDQLTALLGPTSGLLKEISKFKDLYTGNLELVTATADEHTRAVLDALQRTSDTAQAVKEAVVESAIQQQDEVLEMVDRIAPPPPPPPPPRSPLLALPAQTLYGGVPATSDLLNPTWWTKLLDPANCANLAAAASAAGTDAASTDAAAPRVLRTEGGQSQAAAGDMLAHQVAGMASAIRSSLDHQTGGVAVQEDFSVSAITRAARQVSMTLDMAVREYIDRTTQSAAPTGAVPTSGTAGAALGPISHMVQSMVPSQADPWIVQPVVLSPVPLPDGSIVQQPLNAATVLQPLAMPATVPGHVPLPTGGVAAVAQSSQPQTMAIQGILPSTAAAAAAPQLVAVQGPLPACGASGTALLNLPTCGTVLAVGRPVEGLMPGGLEAQPHPAHLLQVLPPGYGVATVAAPATSTAVRPGEGLPCRVNLQMVRIVPQQSASTLQGEQQQLSKELELQYARQQQLRELQELQLPQSQHPSNSLTLLGHADSHTQEIGSPTPTGPKWPLGHAVPAVGYPHDASMAGGTDETLLELSYAVTAPQEAEAMDKSCSRPTTASLTALLGPLPGAISSPPAQSPSKSSLPRSACTASQHTHLDRTRSLSRSSHRRSCSSCSSTGGESTDGRRTPSRAPEAALVENIPTAARMDHGSRHRTGAAKSEHPKRHGCYDGSVSGSEEEHGSRHGGRSPREIQRKHGRGLAEAQQGIGSAGTSLREERQRSSPRSSRAVKKVPEPRPSTGGDCNGSGSGANSRGRCFSVAGSEPSLAGGVAELNLGAPPPSAAPAAQEPDLKRRGSMISTPASQTLTLQQPQPLLNPSDKGRAVSQPVGLVPETSFGSSTVRTGSNLSHQAQRQLHEQQTLHGQQPLVFPTMTTVASGFHSPQRYHDVHHHHQPQYFPQYHRVADSSGRNSGPDSGADYRNVSCTRHHGAASWLSIGPNSGGGPQHALAVIAQGSVGGDAFAHGGTGVTQVSSRLPQAIGCLDVLGSHPSASAGAAGGAVNLAEASGGPVMWRREQTSVVSNRQHVSRPHFTLPSPATTANSSTTHLQQLHSSVVGQGAPASLTLYGAAWNRQLHGAQLPSAHAPAMVPVAALPSPPTFAPTGTPVGYAAAVVPLDHAASAAPAGQPIIPYCSTTPYNQPPGCGYHQQYHQNPNLSVPDQLQEQPFKVQLPQPQQPQLLPPLQEPQQQHLQGHSHLPLQWPAAPESPCTTVGGTQTPVLFSPTHSSSALTGTYLYQQSPSQQQRQAPPMQTLRQPLLSSSGQLTTQQRGPAPKQHFVSKALPPTLPTLLPVPSLASGSEDVQRAYEATLEQMMYSGILFCRWTVGSVTALCCGSGWQV